MTIDPNRRMSHLQPDPRGRFSDVGRPAGVPVTAPPPGFPSPMRARSDRRDVLLDYLDYFREVVAQKVSGLPDADLRSSSLPSGWSPLGLVNHLVHMERRWLVWGFLGEEVADPWGDQPTGDDEPWVIGDGETLDGLLADLRAGGDRTRAIVMSNGLTDVGRPGSRWEGHEPATLDRVLMHVMQEYARHLGHLDVVRELLDGSTGE